MQDFDQRYTAISPAAPGCGRKSYPIRNLYRSLLCLLTLLIIGCGSSSVSDNQLADPTSQLPGHQLWNNYNVYRFEPAANQWTLVIAQSQLVGALPVLGLKPVLITHGFGGSIRANGFSALAQNLLDNQMATTVLGFEYDSQDSIARNSAFYAQALQQLNPGASRLSWALISHSMGGLVTRSAVQTGNLPIAAQGNRVITLGTPHFGSQLANAAQNSGNVAVRAALVTALNQGGFINADGNPSQVSLECQGVTDMRTDSNFLSVLNGNINNHAQVNYFTVAGTRTGNFQSMNDALGVVTDDGFVTIASANAPQLGALGSGLTPTTHTEIEGDANTFTLVRLFLTQ